MIMTTYDKHVRHSKAIKLCGAIVDTLLFPEKKTWDLHGFTCFPVSLFPSKQFWDKPWPTPKLIARSLYQHGILYYYTILFWGGWVYVPAPWPPWWMISLFGGGVKLRSQIEGCTKAPTSRVYDWEFLDSCEGKRILFHPHDGYGW